MDANFLIPVSAGGNGAKASEAGTQPGSTNTAKPDNGSGEPSFGLVLAKVNEDAKPSDSSDSSDNQSTSARPSEEEPSADGALSSLQMTLALQGSVAAMLQTEQSALPGAAASESVPAEDVSSALTLEQAPSDTVPVPTTTLSLASDQIQPASLLPEAMGMAAQSQSSSDAGQELDANRHDDVSTGQAPKVTASTSQAGNTVTDFTMDQPDTDPEASSDIQVKPAGQADPQTQVIQQEKPLVEQGVLRVVAPQSAELARNADPSPLAPPPHPAGTAPQPGINASSAGTAAGDGAMNSQSQQGQAQQTVETGTQVQEGLEGFEQARQAAASQVDGQGKDRKASAGTLAAQPERFASGTNDTKVFNVEGVSKTAAVAPVAATPAEPAGASPLQSLRLEVDRPDLGQVQVRLVLADQTVHAKVTTEHAEVRDFLVTRQGQLEAGLKASGLEMGEFRVDVGSQRQGQADSGWFQGAQRDFMGQGRQRQEFDGGRELPASLADQWQQNQTGGAPSPGAWERRSVNVFA